MNNRNRQMADQLLRQVGKSQDQPEDILIYYVVVNGKKIKVMAKIKRLVMLEDPNNPGMLMPYVMTENIYYVGPDGTPMGPDTRHVGGCAFGHAVPEGKMLKCRFCRSNICLKHAILVGRKAYCRRGLCFIVGLVNKILHWIYRIIRFCVTSVLGISSNDEAKTSEDDYFDNTDNASDEQSRTSENDHFRRS